MSESRRPVSAAPLLLLDAIASLRDDWRRHRLTLVSLIASASAVILLMSLGTGLGAFLDFGVEKTGDRWTTLSGQYSTRRVPGLPLGRRIEFTRQDLERLGNLARVRTAAAEIQLPSVPVSSTRRTRGTCVSAASATLATIRNHVVARGRYFSSEEERGGRRLAVIGAALQEIFFGDEDPIGATLQIEGEPFE
ncbi:MAG: ABC transporter permease, partial [Myxococcota bacterium]